MIYLDWAAAAPPIPEVLESSSEKARELFANPSSLHSAGKASRRCIEEARSTCATYLGVLPERIFFTSSGTESNNIVVTSFLTRRSRGSVVISGIEHPSLFEAVKLLENLKFTVRYIRAESDGTVDPERFAGCVEKDTVLASLMLANNETGAVQDVSGVSRLIRKKELAFSRHVHIHTDAVQAFGKLPLSIEDLGVDSLSASGHKLGAPRGAGLLYLARPLEAVYRGGGQEEGVRPGTENLQAIFGFAKALELWGEKRDQWIEKARSLKRFIIKNISQIPAARFPVSIPAESHDRYLPFIVHASFPPVPGEVLVRVMSDKGFAISTGSACSARGKKNLRVLENMGVDRKVAESAVRISIGPETTEDDCAKFCSILKREAATLAGRIGEP